MNRRVDLNIYAILVAFLITHLLQYIQLGVVTSNESEKYIHQADLLLQGKFPSASKYYYYVPIISLIALAKRLSAGYGLVALVQSLLSAVALIYFYKGTSLLFNRRVVLLSGLGLCLFFPFYSWDFFLYSESTFISLSLLLYYAVCKFEIQKSFWLFAIFLLLFLLIFTRPFGVLFVPPLFLYFLFSHYQSKRFKWITVGCSALFVLVMIVIIDRIFHGGEDMDAMKPFVEEHVICFVPQKPEGAHLNLKYYDNGIKDILYYILHNPLHFFRLMLQRLYSFFKFTRPWYSLPHNAVLLFFILPVYIFFLIGLKPVIRTRINLIIYLLSLIILYPLGMTFQCDDWHSRFTHLVLPPIFVIASVGILFFIKAIKKKT